MTIEVEDKLSKQREKVRQVEEITESLAKGNMALVKTFELLATHVQGAAENGDLFDVREGLELIDLLADLGFGKGGDE